ncbi:mannosyltransferase [Bizionia gelidisalsuginis]|uniref:Mannosyltransferase n=1 Tax=Bizionia gelidisalsuginis TaxID=291188 RepID=A0ABY3M9Y0_9FLAO|nr:mannosyltransferase [Bizionia gelidisalsuginis]TYC12098.1 mannosyltransferase [Bizionia gelidisalsuginis]
MFQDLKLNEYKIPILFIVISTLFYSIFAYSLERSDYLKLFTLYSALFVLFYKLTQISKRHFKLLVIAAIAFRVIFIIAIPNLSQDFYRFIWDGRMLLGCLNPYLYTPESFVSIEKFPVAQAQELMAGMGALSASHFTNYPPINQLCFAIAALFSGKSILGSVVVLRILIIAADLGVLYFGVKLLKRLKIPISNIFWYILNPFIIIELTGNLHFEGIMVFFLVWSLYLLHKNHWKFAAVVIALSISVKLMPLLFLPLFFKWFNTNEQFTKLSFWKLMSFYSIIGGVIALIFVPFLSVEFISNYSKTVGLWFNNFEFNASIYYLFREIGYWYSGYNQIAVIGKLLPVLVFSYVLYLALFTKNKSFKNFIKTMLFAFTAYLFLSTTVHPWYLTTLLFLSIFTNYKFPLVWSFVIIFSYMAYASPTTSENLWLIGLEYGVVFCAILWEVSAKKRHILFN